MSLVRVLKLQKNVGIEVTHIMSKKLGISTMISYYDSKDCDRVHKARKRQVKKQQKFVIQNSQNQSNNQRRRKAA
jgi:hypothetical protein